MYSLEPHPAAPFTTLAGDTKGPCVNVGVPTVHGAPIYVGEQETRSILKTLGWPCPETYEDAIEMRDQALAQLAAVEADLASARDQVAALELLIGLRQSDPDEEPVR